MGDAAARGGAAAPARGDATAAGRLRAELERRLGRRVPPGELHVFESLASTNSWLGERPPPAPGRLDTAIALHQTSGRGRRGKTWTAPPDSGLCLSLAWTYPTPPPDASALTLALGLAAAEALESLGVARIGLKWPNDLVADDRKLGGLLVEAGGADGGLAVVAGIGINVRLPEAFVLPEPASGWYEGITDLAAAGVDASIADVAAAVVPALSRALAAHADHGFAPRAAAYNRRNWLAGRDALVDGRRARCGDVDGAGRLATSAGPLSSGELFPYETTEHHA